MEVYFSLHLIICRILSKREIKGEYVKLFCNKVMFITMEFSRSDKFLNIIKGFL